nr:MAG TPA: hypothetical protein [Caudoviricetes sp.]
MFKKLNPRFIFRLLATPPVVGAAGFVLNLMPLLVIFLNGWTL